MGCSNQRILELILSGKERDEDEMIRCVIKKCRQKCIWQLRKLGAELDAAEDVWQDAIIALIENIRAKKFEGKSSVCTYLTSIAKNLWYQKFRGENRFEDFDTKLLPFYEPEELKADLEYIKQAIRKLSVKCQELFIAKYYQGLTLEAYSEDNGLTSASVRQNHRRCLQKLRDILS